MIGMDVQIMLTPLCTQDLTHTTTQTKSKLRSKLPRPRACFAAVLFLVAFFLSFSFFVSKWHGYLCVACVRAYVCARACFLLLHIC